MLEACEEALLAALLKTEEAELLRLEADAESVAEATALERLDSTAADLLDREEERDDVSLEAPEATEEMTFDREPVARAAVSEGNTSEVI